MNNLFYNKKGEDILSIWWFAVLFIVAGGIVFGTLSFYSDYADIRSFESEILVNKVERCLSHNIKDSFFEGNLDIFNFCNLYKNSFEKDGNFFLKISENDKTIYLFATQKFDEQCKIKKGVIRAKYFPECYEKEIIVFDEEGKNHFLKIVAGSNNKGETGNV